MPNIRHNLIIKAQAEKVFHAISTEEGIQSWWTVQTSAKPNVGNINVQRFEEYFNKMKVMKLKKPVFVEWECVDGDPEWIGTELVFEMEQRGKQTNLRFAHLGWRVESEFYGRCNYQWGRFLESLKAYCETGKGKPFVPALQNT